MSAQQVVVEEEVLPLAEAVDMDEQEAPVQLDTLQRGGRFVSVSIRGFGHLRQGIPEEVLALFPERVRKWLSRPQFYMLPKDYLKRLRALAQRIRVLPAEHGLIVIGIDPRSSGRWIPTSVWDDFLAKFQERRQELLDYLAELDAEHAELQSRWDTIVDILCQQIQLNGGTKNQLLAAFPATFTGLLQVRLTAFRISNPVEVEEVATRRAEARAERLRAEADEVAAEAEQEERARLARDAAADVQWILDQVSAILFEGLGKVVEGLAKGGRATGPAMRRLNNLVDRFSPLLQQQGFSEAGGADLATWLSDLQTQAGQYSRRRFRSSQDRDQARQQVLAAAQRVAAGIEDDAQNWAGLIDETVRAVAW